MGQSLAVTKSSLINGAGVKSAERADLIADAALFWITMETLVEARCITGGYGTTMVLRELSLDVTLGSIYGLLGPNGAGKTTALRMFLGLLRPLSGEIRIFGKQAGVPDVLRRVGSLIEQPSLYDHLTGFENIEIIRKIS
jgi:lantibiotic transport system ATP-binding protein